MYLIGEILNKFTKNSIAYCTKGIFEGTFILCDNDQENENRLYKLKPDGELVFDFYFGVSDEPLEDKKQWVLLSELEDLKMIRSINKRLTESMIESLKQGYKYYVSDEEMEE
jgi:hypothetical protein